MELPKLRCLPVILAASVLTFPLAWLSPATAQDVESGLPSAAPCATDLPPAIIGVLPPAPIELQSCEFCTLGHCAGDGVRCDLSGCQVDCCEYTCVCDPSCVSGSIPAGACPTRLPLCPCGNGSIDPGEQCDGSNLGGQTCESLGYDGGTLTCNGNCTLNTNQCFNEPDPPVCPNGTCEPGEDCESCPDDCPGQSSGKPENRFCCGNGVLEPAEGNGSICNGNP